jgi:hypothetical protein
MQSFFLMGYSSGGPNVKTFEFATSFSSVNFLFQSTCQIRLFQNIFTECRVDRSHRFSF